MFHEATSRLHDLHDLPVKVRRCRFHHIDGLKQSQGCLTSGGGRRGDDNTEMPLLRLVHGSEMLDVSNATVRSLSVRPVQRCSSLREELATQRSFSAKTLDARGSHILFPGEL